MARTSFLLLFLLTACSLGLVTSQHQARKLFIQLGQEQERERALAVEFDQLQLEQSTWAMPARVQRLASQSLRMSAPEAKRIEVVEPATNQPATVAIAR